MLLIAVYNVDDLGVDAISTGNVIGFLWEAYEKGMIDQKFLDGIDLTWGSVDATLAMIDKIASRDGVGDLASKGVKALSRQIGQGSEKFAIHVKGHELAAHNIQAAAKSALLRYRKQGSVPPERRQYCHAEHAGHARYNRPVPVPRPRNSAR